jgi:hypothetical protein
MPGRDTSPDDALDWVWAETSAGASAVAAYGLGTSAISPVLFAHGWWCIVGSFSRVLTGAVCGCAWAVARHAAARDRDLWP